MSKPANSIVKKIYCHPDHEAAARIFRSQHHPDFNVVVDKNCNTHWLYIVLENGKIYHHYLGATPEGKTCQIH